ncbi:MAG: hypothetical protein O2U61_02435 [Candidatus Bathyarchaeota archaeon]|nr:hypothetical protein [Candidatus Bathyarchaeota archaeon]
MKNVEIALTRIQKVRENRERILDLSGLGLQELPEDVKCLTFLFELDISFNNFFLFPEEIGFLENLQFLNCSNNQLIDFNLKPGKRYFFKEIDISNNHLNYVPEDILSLGADVKIIFDNNFFTQGLPPEIAQYEDLSYISFYLDSLEKKEIPKKLFETKILLVGKGEVGKTTLQKTLEDENYRVEIGKENPTHGIDIQSTLLPLIFPAKKPYYNRFEDFEELLIWEGNESSEKLPNLSDKSFNDFEPFILGHLDDETYYLELRVAEEPFKLDNHLYIEKNIKMNFWDFGGQEILYSTHQFFLTARSIYLLVWEPRSDTEIESFDYWLNIIRRLSNNSPVLVVMNKADIRIKQVDEESLRKRFPNILDFHHVSCLTKEGIPRLIRSIKNAVSLLPHIGDRLPHSWDEIRYKLNEMEVDYISYEDFKNICNIKEDDKVNYLSSYLNDLGDIIHFQKDFPLKNLVIINPHWLTEAIYVLIHSLKVQRNLGKFKAEDLEKLLDHRKYPRAKHIEIISLMEKFEICFKVVGSDNQYIIPSLLPSQPPRPQIFEELLQEEDALRAEFQYDFLPSGIIERLLCKMNSFVQSSNYWKFGVILQNENARALLILNSLEKKLLLHVTGDLKAPLFQVIQHNINEINTSLNLKGEDIDIMLACNCSECSLSKNPWMINRKTLQLFLSKKKNSINCLKSTEEVNITTLLIGFKTDLQFKSLLRPFINAASALQARISQNKNSHEDAKNLYLADLLRPHLIERGLIPNDQAQRGLSASGKKAGELDILIEDQMGTPISIYEGLHLRSLDKQSIDSHVEKIVGNYDKNGLKEKFIGVYSLAPNFNVLAKGYMSYLSKLGLLRNTTDISHIYSTGEELKIFRSEIQKYKYRTYLYHILINWNLN